MARAKAYFSGREVEAQDLDTIVEFDGATPPPVVAGPSRSLIREIENEMIRTRLIANRGNQRKTAADLGMPKSTLHDRIRDYEIDIDRLLVDAGLQER